MKKWEESKYYNQHTKEIPSATNSDNTHARKKALKILEYSLKSEKELKDKLKSCGFSSEEADDAVSYACQFGYADDRNYAQEYMRCMSRKKSINYICMELKNKGILQEYIDEAAEEYRDSEIDVINSIIKKKLSLYNEINDNIKNKILKYMVNKGFSYESSKKCLMSFINLDIDT